MRRVPHPLPSITLTGTHVRLEPLSTDHVDDLVRAATIDRSSYRWTVVPGNRAAMSAYVDDLLAGPQRALPFVQRRLDTGELAGCTRFMFPYWWRGRSAPDEVEIGGTWLAATAQRTAVNTEAKLLLLGHAFDTWDVWRVAICTDARNAQSRRAIERIGATFEGVLRQHRPRADGDSPAPRDTACYSVVAGEWPDIRTRLRARLAGAP